MRKKGLIEKLVMGTPAEYDYSARNMQKNRLSLFFYMMQNKFFKIENCKCKLDTRMNKNCSA